MARLVGALPPRLRLCSWTLLYGTKRDGISLQSLYRRGAGRSPTLLLLRDTAGGAFGAFCSEPWRVAPRYFGTGESFVFTLEPAPRLFPWSTANSFFQLGQADSLAVGAGGAFSLWVDDDLHRGTSGRCDTFGSAPLSAACGPDGGEFFILYLELWGFV